MAVFIEGHKDKYNPNLKIKRVNMIMMLFIKLNIFYKLNKLKYIKNILILADDVFFMIISLWWL